MPYKVSELRNVPLYRTLWEKQFLDNWHTIIEYVDKHIEETGQQDAKHPIIENQSGDLLFFGNRSGKNYDTKWQKVVIKNSFPDIDEDLIPLHININFENF